MLGVVTEVVGGSQTLRVERSLPSCGCERRSSEKNRRMVHAGEYSEPVSYTAPSDGNFDRCQLTRRLRDLSLSWTPTILQRTTHAAFGTNAFPGYGLHVSSHASALCGSDLMATRP